jgi:hypothetical protein
MAMARVGRHILSGNLLLGALTVVLIAPFFVFRTIPLYDLPNHIARQHILFGDGAAGATLYYGVAWRLIPNLAMEGFVDVLHAIVSVDIAVRIFLAATAAQLLLGAVAVNRALFGGGARFALAACLFAYNGPFLFGFVNLAFGIGMALWVFALWLHWGRRPAAIPLFALLACTILLAHLFAFAVYALIIVTYRAGEVWRQRRASIDLKKMLASAVPGLLHLILPAFLYLAFMPRELHETGFDYGGVASKVAAILTMMGTGDPAYEALCLFALGTAAVLVARRVVVAPAMIPPLIAAGVVFILLPHRLGEAYFVDYRMPSTIMLLLIASTDWRPGTETACRRAEIVAAAFFAIRFSVLMVHWAAWQPIYDAYRTAFAALPQGAKLLPLRRDPEIFDPREAPPLGQIASFAVTERGALIPSLFADMGHQLLFYRPPYDALRNQAPHADEAAAFDYVLLVRPEQFNAEPLPAFTEIARGPTFVLGRLTHDRRH